MPKPPQPIHPFIFTDHPWRRRPAEYIQGMGWYQGGKKLHNVKPVKHFLWPKDGRNGTKWGRLKDILKNQGPDIHVTMSADKNDYMHNRPRRARWARHTNLDDRGPDYSLSNKSPWVKRARPSNTCYDYRTRKFGAPNRAMWTDALWQEEPNNDFAYPYALRDHRGDWYEQEEQLSLEEVFGDGVWM